MPRRTTVLLSLAVAAAAAARLASRLVAYEIADRSMEPVLHPGDWVLGVCGRRARRGDIVVFEHPERPGFEMAKRVAAGRGPPTGAASLPPGEVWVLGDNPDAGSIDSRSLGPIPRRCLRARLLVRYRPGPPAVLR